VTAYSYDRADRIRSAGAAAYTSDANGNVTTRALAGREKTEVGLRLRLRPAQLLSSATDSPLFTTALLIDKRSLLKRYEELHEPYPVRPQSSARSVFSTWIRASRAGFHLVHKPLRPLGSEPARWWVKRPSWVSLPVLNNLGN
jgi:hypothetical protein